MDAWERFWMCVLASIVCAIGLSFINLYANAQSQEAFRRGYQQGFSQSRAGLCDGFYIGCDKLNHDETKKK